MFSFLGFWALLGLGSKGYPFLAYSRVKTPFQRARNLSPVVFVVVDTSAGCQRITYSQGEYAARFRL
jgi:hypothetical protein